MTSFKGTDFADVGLMVNKIHPAPSSVEDYENLEIPGRSSTIRSEKNMRRNIQIPIECTVVEEDKLRDMYALFQGEGKLIKRDEPDVFYYASPQIMTPKNIILYMHTVTITFDCRPYAYSVDNDPITLRGSDTLIENDGTDICEPIFTLKGSGTIQLTVNGETLTIPNVSGYCTVDAEKLLVHKDNAIIAGTRGKIPKFNIGTNRVQTNASSGSTVVLNRRWI